MAFRYTTALGLTIADVEPPIRRRQIVPRTLNVCELHEITQAAFGWTHSHLHRFAGSGLIVGASEFDENGLEERLAPEATELHLGDLVIRSGETLVIADESD